MVIFVKTIIFNDKEYTNYSGKWVDANYITAPLSLQNTLNYAYVKSLNPKVLSFFELVELADEFKTNGSMNLAIDFYLIALENADEKKVKYLLPKITSSYRAINRPDLVIDIISTTKKKFGTQLLSAALLTSAAAAYCDLGEYENGKKCCDYAFALSKGKSSSELTMVYKRINANLK